MNIAEIQGAANDAYLKTLGPIDLVPSGHYKAIAAAVAAVAPLLLEQPSPSERDQTGDVIFSSGHVEGLRVFLANRLASLTAKPDPLRTALSRWVSEGDMDEAIAAVDAARAK